MRRLSVVLLLLGTAPLGAQSPTSGRLVTADLGHFYRAFDRAAGQDSATRVQIFLEEYLGHASPGLQDWSISRLAGWDSILPRLTARGWSMPDIQKAYSAAPTDSTRRAFMKVLRPIVDTLAARVMADRTRRWTRFYSEIRPRVLALDTSRAVVGYIEHGLAELQSIVPERELPTVYLLVGQGNSGGTIGPSGLLLGVEQGAAGPNTPTEELPPTTRAMLGTRSFEQVAALAVHEAVHALQPRDTVNSLLTITLREGIADYIADQIVPDGRVRESSHQRYGRAHEPRLRRAFRAELRAGRSAERWVYNYGRSDVHGAPDLGYFIGYRIAEAYHRRAGGGRAVLRELILTTAPAHVVRSSHYLSAR
jgi:hypothetical protein